MKNSSVKSNVRSPQREQKVKVAEVVWETTDKFNVPVHLSRSTWEEHIKPKHLEVEPYLQAAKTVVETPHVVSADTQRKNTKIFSKMGIGRGKKAREYLKAVVQYAGGGGRVATLFFDKTLPPGRIICGHKSTKI